MPDYSNAAADPGAEPPSEDTFFEQTKQLRKILAWARCRQTSPWALFGAVALRVAACTPPNVQLPPVIGDYVSLNMFCGFVSRSGGGKGKSDKVSKRAWPAPIAIRMPGSGEGLAELFMVRGRESEDNERLTAAIVNAAEIDTLAGLASRQGSILLAQLKNAWMGEDLGQHNASKATSRHVAEHDYRLCLSVGVQPGHAGVIFADTSGGAPQRFLWLPTEDPDMPEGGGDDPEPLDTSQPLWRPGADGVVAIQYDPPEIAATIRSSDLARSRGEGDALDGHAVLQRCKVAAQLAVMHQRQNVTALDWALSGIVMQVSDRTRESLLEHDRQAARARIRERAIGRAIGEEFVDQRRHDVVLRRVRKILSDGPATYGDINRRVGKREYRELLGAALADLLRLGEIASEELPRGTRYSLTPEFNVEPEFNHDNHRSGRLNHKFNVEPECSVTDLDTRRSHDPALPKPSCQKWFDHHIATLKAAGHTTAESFAIYAAGEAEGYTRGNISQAVAARPDIILIAKTNRGGTWSLTGDATAYKPATTWVHEYLDALRADTDTVDKDHYRKAAESAGYSWEAARVAALKSGRIESDTGAGVGRRSAWRIVTKDEETA